MSHQYLLKITERKEWIKYKLLCFKIGIKGIKSPLGKVVVRKLSNYLSSINNLILGD